MTSNQRAFVLTVMAIGLISSLAILTQRVMVERKSNIVGIAVDFLEVEQLAGVAGVSLEAMLQQLRAAGATHLALSEDSLQSLLGRGEASIKVANGEPRIRLSSAYRVQQVAAALSSRFPGRYVRKEGAGGEQWLICPPAATSLLATGVGYSREALEAARSVGLQVVARPCWQGIRSREAVNAALRLAADAGARIIAFNGDQVMGFPGLIGATAEAMRANNLVFGFIELAPQGGDAALSAHLEHCIVRVHSITDLEMRTISVTRAMERFAKAARERGVRLCYARLFAADDRGPVHINVDYLTALSGELRAQGLSIGLPEAFEGFQTPWWLVALVRLGALGAGLWLVQSVFALPGPWFWALAGLWLLAGSAGMATMRDTACALGALGTAVIFPLLAVGWVAAWPAPRRESGDGVPWGHLLRTFVAVCAFTAFGGLIVAALLADSAHMMGVAQFRGVKLAQLLPLLAVALVWLARETVGQATPADEGAVAPEWGRLWVGWRTALRKPVRYWHAVAALVGLVLLAVLVLRSGNEAESAILPGELQFRALLDKLLVVRPRTKEVFLGHPMMVLGLLLLARGMPKGSWIALSLGTIGQVSLLNSFCHLHTPLLLTLLRVFNGVWVGAAGGVILCLIWQVASRTVARHAQSQAPPGGP